MGGPGQKLQHLPAQVSIGRSTRMNNNLRPKHQYVRAQISEAVINGQCTSSRAFKQINTWQIIELLYASSKRLCAGVQNRETGACMR